ncbi:MraY-like glycosyltransferase [Planctomycetes bacterium MalM25]|nr:MraY-like glycosyltransferase [Planctomycetes bacterium MalM25]
MSQTSPPDDPSQPDAERYHDRIDISEEDDDFEYEVEPVDEQVLANEKARAQMEVARAENAIDVDAVYQELDSHGDLDAVMSEFKARFSLRTLLIAMTVIAVVLGLAGSTLFNGAGFAALICLSLFGLGTAHMWLNFQERKRREAVLAKRDRQLERARRLAEDPNWVPDPEDEDEPPSEAVPNPLAELLGIVTRAPRFTLAEMLLGMTLAVVIVTLLRLTGSPAGAAVALGAVTVTVFAMQAADMDVPRPLLIAWWLSLAGYCLLTLAWVFVG